MKTFVSIRQARRKLEKTPITDAELAKCGFYIIGNDFSMGDLIIIKWSDGFYYGTTKLNHMMDISNLVYGKKLK